MNHPQPFANVTLYLNRMAGDTASQQTLTLHSALADWSGVPDLTGANGEQISMVMDIYPLRSTSTAQQQAVYGLPSAAQFAASYSNSQIAVYCDAAAVQALLDNRYVFTITARLPDDRLVLLADGQLMMRHEPTNNQHYN